MRLQNFAKNKGDLAMAKLSKVIGCQCSVISQSWYSSIVMQVSENCKLKTDNFNKGVHPKVFRSMFCLTYREVFQLLSAEGIAISFETVKSWLRGRRNPKRSVLAAIYGLYLKLEDRVLNKGAIAFVDLGV